MSGFKLQRLGMIMEPEPGNPRELEGVLNPGVAHGPDGELYLFPRLVAKGNYSRIGIARVRFNEAGDPTSVDRLGIALEPEADYELRPDGGGGCEDPRVTFVEPLKRYIMTYVAFSPHGPRIAMAESEDLFHWKRMGLATYAHWHGIELDHVDDKDASMFPVAIPNSAGKLELGMLHRPLFPGTRPEEAACRPGARLNFLLPPGADERDAGSPGPVYVSSPAGDSGVALGAAQNWRRNSAHPDETRLADRLPRRCYSAGVMVLSQQHPRVIHYRSDEPVLTPVLPQERDGTVANVVFPTGIDRRDDLGTPDRFDVYYGMADDRIVVARLDLPEQIPSEAVADAPEAKV